MSAGVKPSGIMHFWFCNRGLPVTRCINAGVKHIKQHRVAQGQRGNPDWQPRSVNREVLRLRPNQNLRIRQQPDSRNSLRRRCCET